MITGNSPYFAPGLKVDGLPPPSPLSHTVQRTVRFEEVDSLGMVWHGHYPSYFEDARVALGDAYGVGYMDLLNAKIITPVKQMGIDYMIPLRFPQKCRITATLHWTDAAKINLSYMIHDCSGALLTTGYTVQLFIAADQTLCMVKPDFYQNFCQLWENGRLPSPAL
ncbi:MAG: acyl-CoA thioesterase [Deltaproteobacteria bacterium]|jgi:acyl-CoA thioester hydrolase|nr:acyl-CoA thioesterase [Deltaproteobacteria bacterium]